MATNNYFIGIDGGGTKTEFCFLEIETGKRSYFISGSSNYKTTKDQTVKRNLIDSLKIYAKKNNIDLSQIKGVVAGIAGCDNEEDKLFYNEIFENSGIEKDRICICNDAYLAFGSTKEDHGIVVVAGTGTICLGIRKNKESLRCGGWGFPISDLGSGLWIASEALTDLVTYCDGYGNYHEIFEKFKEKIGAEKFSQIPEIITSYKIRDYASFAKTVMDCADRGDEYCLSLAESAVSHIVVMAKVIYNKFSDCDREGMEFITLGGLFSHRFFREEFLRHLEFETKVTSDKVRFIDSRPVDGAIKIAERLFCQK